MKSTIRFILVAALGAASVSAETAYRIDIGRTDQPLLKTGYTALNQNNSTTGGSVTIDGDLFQLGGNIAGSRNRNVTAGIDELEADFVFGNTGTITLSLGSAGGLQAGTWQLSIYSSDFNIGSGVQDQRIGIMTTTGMGTTEQLYGAAVDQSSTGPAITFRFTSDGSSAYTLFVRDSEATGAGFDDIRLNGIDLVFVPDRLSARIDIGTDTTSNLKAGYTGLTGVQGSTATVDTRLFTLNVSSGLQGTRDRGAAPGLGVDELTRDFGFVQADAGNVEMTLNLGGAGALKAGTWHMSVYSADWNVGLAAVVDQRIGIITTTGMTTSEATYGAAVDSKFDGPAITFTFTSDGVSAYSLFLRDSLDNPTAATDATDAVRLNGIDLVFVPQLSGFTYNPGDGSSQVSITGSTGVRYRLVEADDLDFANPDQDPIPLTGATVGTLNSNEIIADENGNATVQFNLGTAKPATFLRAQTVP